MTEIINAGSRKVPIDSLAPHPDNPREGDLGAIIASVEAHGFYGQVIVQKSTGRIVAGNHRWMAAKHAGLSEIPVTYIDVDDETARRILVADNRTSDLGSYDESQLVALLKDLAATGAGLAGTGYDGGDLDDLIHKLGDGKEGHPYGREKITCPECGHEFVKDAA